MRRVWIALVLGALGWAQDKPEFEVASVKAHTPDEGMFSFDITPSGRLTVKNMTVWNLARQAFRWRDSQMTGGPGWVKSAGFDVVAQAGEPGPVPGPRVLAMLGTLLQDRFHFRWHEEMRESSAYALRVAPGGPKLGPAKEGQSRMKMGDMSVPKISMESLCQILEFDLSRPVVDQTGLTGDYSLTLQWARENAPAQDADTSRPSLFTAVREQLGLRLEPGKLPVKVFVIDDVQRPTEN